MNKLELLAPAGSLEACKAVVQAGADAVYLGGERFGARAYAKNLTKEELSEAIDYAHLYGKSVYLTVNTLLKQTELNALFDYLAPLYEQGLDAVIVQDIGVLESIRNWFPALSIHASTQMSVTGADGAFFLKRLGVSRIVPARELSLKEIKDIYDKTGMELECFVHGALCYCYSGQCLLSSMIGARSGNRGRCAQPCRLPYQILDAQKKLLTKTECYPLSMKDLCALDQLSLLADASVFSFKIEGRMKSAEYAAGVTAIYRKRLDALLNGEPPHKASSQNDYQCLLETGSRSGFTDGYYKKRNGADMVTIKDPGHCKSGGRYLADVADAYIHNAKKIPVRAKACFEPGKTALMELSFKELSFKELSFKEASFKKFSSKELLNGKISAKASYGEVQEAKTTPLSEDQIRKQLSKTGNTPFVFESAKLDIELEIKGQAFMPKQALNELRRRAFEELKAKALSPYRRTDAAFSVLTLSENLTQTDAPKKTDMPIYAAIEEVSQLNAVLEADFIKRIYLDCEMYSYEKLAERLKKDVSKIHAAGKQAYLALPSIFRMDTANRFKSQWKEIECACVDGYLAKSYDELGFLEAIHVKKERVVLDHSLYSFSNTAKMAFEKAGWANDTLPFELNKKELSHKNCQTSELIVYGRTALMTSAQCLKKTTGGCEKKRDVLYLKDRLKNEFPVRQNCGACYNVIYNKAPLSLLQFWEELMILRPAAFRLQFTIERAGDVERILNCVRLILNERAQSADGNAIKEQLRNVIKNYTNGHYKRGVE